MFKKFKDRLSEVSEEVKKDPRFQNSLASVNKIAADTLGTLSREKSASKESLASNASQTSGQLQFQQQQQLSAEGALAGKMASPNGGKDINYGREKCEFHSL